MFTDYSKYKGVIVGTGPSLSQEQIDYINEASADNRCRVFGVNNAFKVIDLDVLLSCNPEWWDYYADDPDLFSAMDQWTWDLKTADKYDLNHIKGKWGDSICTDPEYIHYGHSSGFQIINLAYHYGIREFILVGYDMKYGEGYNNKKRIAGTGRHFFGEYPKELLHWPKVGDNNEFVGLLEKVYKKIDCEELGIRIINCSPGSALDFFEVAKLEDVL